MVLLLLMMVLLNLMDGMDQLSRNHIHAHLPLFTNIAPIIPIMSVFYLIPNLVFTYLLARGVHTHSLTVGE